MNFLKQVTDELKHVRCLDRVEIPKQNLMISYGLQKIRWFQKIVFNLGLLNQSQQLVRPNLQVIPMNKYQVPLLLRIQ